MGGTKQIWVGFILEDRSAKALERINFRDEDSGKTVVIP